ncbi:MULTISPECIES: hypothetical protein [Methylorubrum]|uniref:hypothetical protein n=1 Tax=Methylorubrum TaxID=2282523 RepID=UPI00209CD1AE|nr:MULTISPECIES: hypothetical protein [Methylorubrum]MCP1547271.1 hypothetical protein [Methylorubrum zatmanii]MCP1556113.1 hypothetical protein [Methylorubrum extorquens]MCP1577574.1 hypothetical protein [Methylorubrum extorquens]
MKRGQKTSAEQVVLKLRQIEVQTAQGKRLALACKEASFGLLPVLRTPGLGVMVKPEVLHAASQVRT